MALRVQALGRPGGKPEPMVSALAEGVFAHIPRSVPAYIDRGTVDTHAYEYGVAGALVRSGRSVYFTTDFQTEVGARRAATPPSNVYRLAFGTGDDLPRLRALPGAEQIAQANGVFVYHYN